MPTNLHKIGEVLQGPAEIPAISLERMWKKTTCPIYPSIQKLMRTEWWLTCYFIQLALNIWKINSIGRKDLKKTMFSEIVKVGHIVFNNRDKLIVRRKVWKANLLAVRETGTNGQLESNRWNLWRWPEIPKPFRHLLDLNQCAYVKKGGHWKNECLNWKTKMKRATVL